MRRLLLFVLACAFAAPAASAQLIPRFGVTGGLNFSSLADAGTADVSSATGFHVGVYTELGAGGVSVRPALLYVRAGSVDYTAFGGGDDESVNFFAIPVDLKARLATPIVKPYALVGPEFRFVQGSITDFNTSSYTLAANAGLGVELSALIGPNAFAELRYGFDLQGVADDEAGGGSVKVNLIQLRVGVGL